MSALEWIAAIGVIIVVAVIALAIVSFLGLVLIVAVLDARDEMERGRLRKGRE